MKALHDFFARIWEGLEDRQSWKESYLVPLPKKGDLWRGSLLASIPSKVFARVFYARLAAYAEELGLLPESQSGFRAGRGTMDMVFSFKMAMEIADYKKHPFHVLFVDLVKAYDSVARVGLWEIWQKRSSTEDVGPD